MDVTHASAIARAVDQALSTFGRIDVLVNNAGFGLTGAIEEVSDDEGTACMPPMSSGLPHMRDRQSGHIITISSIAGVSGSAGLGAYSASKFAVEGMSEALETPIFWGKTTIPRTRIWDIING
ncbi:MAG TPA: SDR family NAD(P)-dependent oxidoreductase [Ktedonobacteraceae bacterium]|nr:SDR family NAD(P)-dependent oxidoreductase [Ktedonobacteraceae bacterium]